MGKTAIAEIQFAGKFVYNLMIIVMMIIIYDS
jgi:hypothetical protein